MAKQATLNQVQQLYVAYYGRPADAKGQAFWAEALEANGGDTSVIINDFGKSAEFEARFGEMSSEELVNNLYQQLFGRDAEAGGLAFYVGHLDAGNLTLAEMAAEIAGGAQDGEGNADATALFNKVVAANLYTRATEGQHSGTDADNYAADWLSGINADTAVEAIDMGKVVADLPEPTEPTETEPEAPLPGDGVAVQLEKGNVVKTITESSAVQNDAAVVVITEAQIEDYEIAWGAVANSAKGNFGSITTFSTGGDELELVAIEFKGHSTLRDHAQEVGYDEFIDLALYNGEMVTAESLGVDPEVFFYGDFDIPEHFGYDWPWIESGPEIITRDDGADFHVRIELLDALGIANLNDVFDFG